MLVTFFFMWIFDLILYGLTAALAAIFPGSTTPRKPRRRSVVH